MIFFVAPQAGRFAQRYGSRWPMSIGPILAGTGLFIVSRAGVDTPYALMAPFLSVMGIGMGMTMAPMTAAVMNAVGPERAGLGSATTNTSREVGGLLGIALLGTLLTTQLRTSLASAIGGLGLDASRQAEIVASGGHLRLDPATLQGLPPQQVDAIRDAFATSFVSGFRLAGAVAAACVVMAGIIANRFIPSGAPQHDGEGHTDFGAAAPPATKKAPARPKSRTNGRKPARKPSSRKPAARKPAVRRPSGPKKTTKR
jgi:MFS family permease